MGRSYSMEKDARNPFACFEIGVFREPPASCYPGYWWMWNGTLDLDTLTE